MKTLCPLGVDIVEWKKARVLYETHRRTLRSFLTPAENRFVERGPKPHEALAMILAAKEAAFKALGASWMGPEGFRKIEIHPKTSRPFLFSTTGSLRRGISNKMKLRIAFKKSRRHVIAYCYPSRVL